MMKIIRRLLIYTQKQSHVFQQLAQRSLSSNAPSKTEKVLYLQMIPKEVETLRMFNIKKITMQLFHY